MKFERVDEKTIRCFISNEELEDYQIDYKDFVLRSEKAREVVRDIITQASEEVGYKPPKFAFDMSIMMLPEQGLVLTFSESDPLMDKDGGRLMEYLKEMKNAFMNAATKKGENQQNAPTETGAKKGKDAEQPVQPEEGIFEFRNLADVMELASVVPKTLRVHSELYRMKDRYYLYLQKGTAAYQRYSKLCIQAMEFAEIYGANQQKLLFVKEHGECLIADGALRKLHVEKEPRGVKKAAGRKKNI
ncbi:MAG: adaptor protein MecA [Lachnospiraceae bacterium]|jgi:adapter protein MecA 1/2|nr:adaptor protein MecA [Lachnospiraceae bacterium]